MVTMRPHLLAAVVFALSLLVLSGCVELRVTHYFFPNGRSHVVQALQISGLLEVLNTSSLAWNNQSGYGVWDDLANYSCDAVKRYEQGATCHRSGDWLMIDQEKVSDVDYVFKSFSQFPYIIYEVRILRPPALPAAIIASNQFVPNLTSRFFSNASFDEAAALKGTGMTYKYRVVMPGEIFNISAGYMVGNEMEFDVLSQAMSHSPVIVKSREYDWGQIAIAAIFALDVFLFIDIAAIFAIGYAKRHKEQLERLRAEAREKAERARAQARSTKLKGYDVYSFESGDSISKIGDAPAPKPGKK